MERWRLRRAGFVLLCALAALATGGAMVWVLAPGGAGARERDACTPPGTSATAVRDRFVATAVLRVDTACSYELVTPELRQGLTREQWAAGEIPVIPFHTALPGRVTVRVAPRDAPPGQRASLVSLTAADIGEYVFEVVLVRRAGRWLVGYWNAAPWGAALSAPRAST